jgi:hypothetical protein
MGLQQPEVAQQSGWWLSLYPEAAEAGGSFRYSTPCRPSGGPSDPERAMAEAARRARGKVRRYCAANRLNRLGTLTYAGSGCHDAGDIRSHLAAFFRALRKSLGGRPLPYVWTTEWHKSDHGLHVHFAVGRFVARSLIEDAWGRGFVHIKLLGDLPVGSGALEEARKAAGYLSKYVGKAFDEARVPGLHRYEVAQRFQPVVTRLHGRTADEVVDQASGVLGREPVRRWSSDEVRDWRGPPAVWVSWAG